MSELKTIGNKLFKTELGTQKVELASLKELQKSISDIKGGISEVEKRGNQLAKELSQAEKTKFALGDSVKSILSYGQFTKSQIDDFKTKAKDLGVDVSNVKELKELEDLQKLIKDYQTFFNGLGKIPTF
jgi:predicted  nucleic acid-binding Zn-ribbon protein